MTGLLREVVLDVAAVISFIKPDVPCQLDSAERTKGNLLYNADLGVRKLLAEEILRLLAVWAITLGKDSNLVGRNRILYL